MIRLTFSPEFPSRAVKVGYDDISGGKKMSDFWYATVFPHLRGGRIGIVGGRHRV